MIYKNIKDFEQAICEGLIHTNDINTSISILRKWYESMTNYFKIDILNNDTFEITIKNIITTSLFEILIRDINNLGYFPSLIRFTNKNHIKNSFKYDYDKINNVIMSKKIIGIEIVCEKKFDDEVKILNKVFHVCREQNVKKILEIGLYPKSKNRIVYHPDRVYFCLDIQSCIGLINRFKINDTIKNLPEQRYKILEIDIPKLKIDFLNLNKKIIFRKDPNLNKNGIYTYDNIPKQYIKIKNNLNSNE